MHRQLPSLDVLGAPRPHKGLFPIGQIDPEVSYDFLCDVILNIEQVRCNSIVPIGPDMAPVGGIEELRGNAQAVAASSNTPFKDEANTQLRHSSHDDFVKDLARVWSHLKKRADEIDLYARFGTINSVKSDARELIRSSLEESGDWELVSTRLARTASSGKWQADQMQLDSNPAEEFDFHAVAT